MAVTPNDVTMQRYLGLLAARRGDRAEAMRISEHVAEITDRYEFGRDAYIQAVIAAQLGDLDRAMVLLRESYAKGRMFGIFMHRDTDLEPLRERRDYEVLVRPKG